MWLSHLPPPAYEQNDRLMGELWPPAVWWSPSSAWPCIRSSACGSGGPEVCRSPRPGDPPASSTPPLPVAEKAARECHRYMHMLVFSFFLQNTTYSEVQRFSWRKRDCSRQFRNNSGWSLQGWESEVWEQVSCDLHDAILATVSKCDRRSPAEARRISPEDLAALDSGSWVQWSAPEHMSESGPE